MLNLTSPIVTMTSLELVEFINGQRKPIEPELRHDNFMAKAPKVLGEEHALNFKDMVTVTIGGGATRQSPIYRFPKREACLMAMSYSYELQAKVFDRMTALETEKGSNLPQTFAQALRLAAEQAEKIEEQQKALELAAPKVQFVDSYVESTGLKGFREVAKLLKIKEPDFRVFLIDNKIMYRLGGEWMAYQNHIDAGRFEVKTGVSRQNDHAFNTCKFTSKGVEWVAAQLASWAVRAQMNLPEQNI
jgi:phage antirepressor YoqD-like protein